jgi:quercetin dioxygenase-like cupin family protein
MELSRRSWCLSLAAALASARSLAAQSSALPSRVYPYDELPVRQSDGNSFRHILDGSTHRGVRVEAHATELAPGLRPHAPHRHKHEEMFLVREGTVEVLIEGKATKLGPGSVAFVASNEEHGIRNVGSAPARYFVVTVGMGGE